MNTKHQGKFIFSMIDIETIVEMKPYEQPVHF